MIDSIESPTKDAVATSTRIALPKQIVVAVLVLTFLPYLLNLLASWS